MIQEMAKQRRADPHLERFAITDQQARKLAREVATIHRSLEQQEARAAEAYNGMLAGQVCMFGLPVDVKAD